MLSTALGLLKVWELFFKDRVKADTTYTLSGARGGRHEIIVANLSSLPIQVAYWELAWEPRWSAFWLSRTELAHNEALRFKISGHDKYHLVFAQEYQFRWDTKVASGKRLVLTLKLFGRKRKLKLVVGAGYSAKWWRSFEQKTWGRLTQIKDHDTRM